MSREEKLLLAEVGLMLALMLAPGCHPQPPQHTLPNFGVLQPGQAIYHSGRLPSDGCRLIANGVTNVIKLST
jgi:hypothetical protein